MNGDTNKDSTLKILIELEWPENELNICSWINDAYVPNITIYEITEKISQLQPSSEQ